MYLLFFLMVKNIYLSVLVIILFGCKGSEQLVYQDLSFLYAADSPVLKTKIYFTKEDSVTLFLSITKKHNLKSFNDLLGRYKFSGKIASHYSDGNVVSLDSISLKIIQKWESEEQMILAFSLPERNVKDILFISIYDLKKGQVRLLDIGQVFRKDGPDKIVLMTNQDGDPVVNKYINAESSFHLLSDVNIEKVSFNLFKNSFSPAVPPYVSKERSLDHGEIKADSSGFVFLDSKNQIAEEGLVVFTANNKIPGCFSYLIKSGKYPELSTAKDLVDPLIYITTPDELRKLNSSKNSKKEVDNFWLGIGGSVEFSRELIKHYYSRVEFSNRYFTTYKEGWKTDKGMIFIIFGRPDAVNRFGEYEEWHYEHLLSKDFYTFTFRKQPIFLSNDNYELVRKEEHGKVWYPMVEKWRKGIIIKNSK